MTNDNDRLLADILEECSQSMAAGETAASCVDRYPEFAAVLAPLLETLSQLRALHEVPERAQEVSAQRRDQFLRALSSAFPSTASDRTPVVARRGEPVVSGFSGWWERLVRALTPTFPRAFPAGLAALLAVVVLVGAALTGAISASADSIPGDLLYPVKTTVEQARVLLTISPAEKAQLIEQMDAERRSEVDAVLRAGRAIKSLPLHGAIESIAADQWLVSGLAVRITPGTVISGVPQVGATVRGTVSAPGDGTLVGTLLAVEAPSPVGLEPVEPSPAEALASPSPWPTSLPTPTSDEFQPSRSVPPPLLIPTDPPLWTPTALPTTTRTATVTSSVTPTLTPTPIREVTKYYPSGIVVAITDGRWTIGTLVVETDDQTEFLRNPGLGDEVQAVVIQRSDGSYLALQIVTLRRRDAPPEPFALSGSVTSINGAQWSIGSYVINVTGETVITGDPGVGDLVDVTGERRSDGQIFAHSITRRTIEQFFFEGIVESISGDQLVVGGQLIYTDANTSVSGLLVVGAHVLIAGEIRPDGRAVATRIAAEVPEPSPSPTATPSATPSPTSTLAWTAIPTATPTETPWPTATPTSTQPPTDAPSATPQPDPTSTSAPEPTLTATPAPEGSPGEPATFFTPEA
jgi:hypothetical protein